jgi:DNA-binding Xre family transcriptional regulator
MSTKFKDEYGLNPDFAELFNFPDKEARIEHEAKMLMFKFLSALEKSGKKKKWKKKELALAIGTSPSYITQLYKGDKLINLHTLAKLQEAYEVSFEIKVRAKKMMIPAQKKQRHNEDNSTREGKAKPMRK